MIQSLSSKHLNEGESKCVSQCAEKFMKLTQRVGFRLAEYQGMQGQQQLQGSNGNTTEVNK